MEEERHGTEIGVFGDALGSCSNLCGFAAWVVVEARFGGVVTAEVLEEARSEVGALLESAEKVEVYLVAVKVKGFHGGAEAGNVRFVGPAVGVHIVVYWAEII